jgi:hypothetical protein
LAQPVQSKGPSEVSFEMNVNTEIVHAITKFISILGAVALFFLGILTGYWLARNSQDQPFIQNKVVSSKKGQGPTIEPEHGDIFKDAMKEPDTDDEDRIPTMDTRLS